jgi:TDG/mug DNA glycosylase family protein
MRTLRPGAGGSRPAGSAPGWRRRAHNCNCPKQGRCGGPREPWRAFSGALAGSSNRAAAAGEQEGRARPRIGGVEGSGQAKMGSSMDCFAPPQARPAAGRAGRRAAADPGQPAGRGVAGGRALLCPPAQPVLALAGRGVGEPLDSAGYEERLDRLLGRGIALVGRDPCARRQGSLDQAMREIEARDLPASSAGPARASRGRLQRRHGGADRPRALGGTGLTLIDLPSSSPAYTLPFAAKANAGPRWRLSD